VDEALDNYSSLYRLLSGSIDYAGLFPPAGLDLATALANYRAYRGSADAWALGRFVVPAARLNELEGLLLDGNVTVAERLPLTVLLGTAGADEVTAIEHFNARSGEHGGRVESVEVKTASDNAVRAVLAVLPVEWNRYLEISLDSASDPVLEALVAGRAFAKIRTGGVTPDAFPEVDQLVHFLQAAARRRLAFKATAGLHHPLRGCYRLSYAEAAPQGVMYGFLNLFLAATLAWGGAPAVQLRAALLEDDPAALRLDPEVLQWRELRIGATALAQLRENFCHSFGSCSFREPLDQLAAGGWT
jgi:hypothetical protein